MNSKENYQRCFHTHPALPLRDGLVVYGGSCMSPVVKDADVYIGLDFSMTSNPRSFPWNPGEWFLFPIKDMHAPADVAEFSKMIDWLILQVSANKKVHVGCIGGHGRTGTVLSALVARFLGVEDAISYVRKNYCPKAVETTAQIDFLVKHFGVSPAAPTKEAYKPASGLVGWEAFDRPQPRQSKGGGQQSLPLGLASKAEKTSLKMKMNHPTIWHPTKDQTIPAVWGSSVEVERNLLK